MKHETMGERLRRVRKEQGYSIIELGLLTDIDPCYISRWERGVGTPSVKYFKKLCRILNQSADYLLCRKDE